MIFVRFESFSKVYYKRLQMIQSEANFFGLSYDLQFFQFSS
jgi:hypothetical protein